jgi:hypothetical protein
MTTQNEAAEAPTQALVELAVEELRQRVTTLEVEVAHWERTCRVLAADLRTLMSARRHCQAERTTRRDSG